jgi:enterochelin esterase-like enzyme
MIPLLVRKRNTVLLIAVLFFTAALTGCSGYTQPEDDTGIAGAGTAQLPTSTVLLPSVTPTTLPRLSAGMSSRVEVLFFESSNYPKAITTRIYLPPGYDLGRKTPYPVLLILHGKNSSGSQWEDLGLLAAADDLIGEGNIPPLVIVMPEEVYSTLPYTETTYADVLVDELLPFLYSQYNLCQERDCTAIGGLSRGAAWAARLVFTRWEVFGTAGMHSMPAAFLPLTEWIEEIPPDSMPNLYMDIGLEDVGYKDAREFEALLTRLDIPHEWVVQPGVHAAEYWSAHVRDYLRWYGKTLSQ